MTVMSGYLKSIEDGCNETLFRVRVHVNYCIIYRYVVRGRGHGNDVIRSRRFTGTRYRVL